MAGPYSYKRFEITQAMIDAASPDVRLTYTGNNVPIQLFDNDEIPHSDQLTVTLNGEALDEGSDYEVAVNNSTVDIDPSVLKDGDIVVIRRITDIDARLLDFQDNSGIDEKDLDTDSDQSHFLIQELYDGLQNTIQLDIVRESWDGQGYPTHGFDPATTQDGLVTLSQVLNLISGTETASITGGETFIFTGDGSQTEFSLSGSSPDIDADQLDVYVGFVIQVPDIDYTVDVVDGTATITFSTAPANGAHIMVRFLHGTVRAVVGTSSIDGEAIVPFTLPINRLIGSQIGGGDVNNFSRFLVVNEAGGVREAFIEGANIPNISTYVAERVRLNELLPPDGPVNMASQRLINLTMGSAATDAATKGYVDNQLATKATVLYGTGTTVAAGGSSTVNLGTPPRFVLVSAKNGNSGSPSYGRGNTDMCSSESGRASFYFEDTLYAEAVLSGSSLTYTNYSSDPIRFNYMAVV